jgi:hypothetical protein
MELWKSGLGGIPPSYKKDRFRFLSSIIPVFQYGMRELQSEAEIVRPQPFIVS